jgi:hypothetical protein
MDGKEGNVYPAMREAVIKRRDGLEVARDLYARSRWKHSCYSALGCLAVLYVLKLVAPGTRTARILEQVDIREIELRTRQSRI